MASTEWLANFLMMIIDWFIANAKERKRNENFLELHGIIEVIANVLCNLRTINLFGETIIKLGWV